jgi:hypothetical protein
LLVGKAGLRAAKASERAIRDVVRVHGIRVHFDIRDVVWPGNRIGMLGNYVIIKPR